MAKVVFCEDEKMMQELIRRFLRPHEIHIASDGVEGLKMIERTRPDVILLDISMPRCDGFELARALKANPSLANIPIIFITGFGQKDDEKESAKYSSFYLMKPFGAYDLRTIISMILLKSTGGTI